MRIMNIFLKLKSFTVGLLVLSLFINIFLLSCKKSNTIDVGFVAALSGRKSELGVLARNGARLAIKEINERGGIKGKKLKLIIRDNKEDPEVNKTVINDFINGDIKFIIGPLMSKMAKGTLEAINNKNVLVISPTISTEAVKNLDDNFLRIMNYASFQTNIICTKMIKDGMKRTVLIYDLSNKEYVEPIASLFKKKFVSMGGKIVYENSFKEKSKTTFSSIADQIISKRADSILFVTSGIDAAVLCQQLYKKKYGIAKYGTTWVRTGDIIKHGGRSVEGLIFTNIFTSKKKSKVYLKFYDNYIKDYHKKPVFIGQYSYESLMILSKALKESNSQKPAMVKHYIITKGSFQGLQEIIKINKYGDAFRKLSLVVIKNGEFSLL